MPEQDIVTDAAKDAEVVVAATDAAEMSNERTELISGVWMEAKLTVESAMALETRFNKPLAEMNFNLLSNAVIILYYLVRQCQPDMVESEFMKIVNKLDIIVVKEAVIKALQLRLKNFPESKLLELLKEENQD